MVGLTKTLAKEWGQFKINVNAVAFGFVETRLTAAKESGNVMVKDGEEIQLGIPEQMRAMAAMIIPLGRPATPEEAAGPVFFLCSPWSELRARPGAQRDRRPVRRHVHLMGRLATFPRKCEVQGPPGEDAGSRNSSAISATEDVAWRFLGPQFRVERCEKVH